MRILTFADFGLGNLIFYLPVLRSLTRFDLTIITPNPQFRLLLHYNLNVKFEQKGDYDVAIHNFLTLRKQDVLKSWRIPKRIGHIWEDWHKWGFRLTDKILMRGDKGEEYYNNLLLQPLGLNPVYKTLYPLDMGMKSYDIVIAPFSSTPKKDWRGFSEILPKYQSIEVLTEKYNLLECIDLIRKAKIFIGNDSGLAKVSAHLNKPTIQIFRYNTDCFVRAKIKGYNLIEPELSEVLEIIERHL